MLALQYGFNFDKKKMSMSMSCATLIKPFPTNVVLANNKNFVFGLDIIYIAEKYIGKVIGSNGRNIKSIRKLSKAEIDIEKSSNDSNNRQITLIGTECQIKTAMNLINNILNIKT